MQAAVAQQMETIWSISDIAERYGQVSYEFQPQGLARQMDICGLKLLIEGNHITRVMAADMDIRLHWHMPANTNFTANDHAKMGDNMPAATVLFKHGDTGVLATWLQRLRKYTATCVA